MCKRPILITITTSPSLSWCRAEGERERATKRKTDMKCNVITYHDEVEIESRNKSLIKTHEQIETNHRSRFEFKLEKEKILIWQKIYSEQQSATPETNRRNKSKMKKKRTKLHKKKIGRLLRTSYERRKKKRASRRLVTQRPVFVWVDIRSFEYAWSWTCGSMWYWFNKSIKIRRNYVNNQLIFT